MEYLDDKAFLEKVKDEIDCALSQYKKLGSGYAPKSLEEINGQSEADFVDAAVKALRGKGIEGENREEKNKAMLVEAIDSVVENKFGELLTESVPMDKESLREKLHDYVNSPNSRTKPWFNSAMMLFPVAEKIFSSYVQDLAMLNKRDEQLAEKVSDYKQKHWLNFQENLLEEYLRDAAPTPTLIFQSDGNF